jgi:mannose/cellobiose epimerase-like protein (N-acyl-D-glucosamine 2-epimerase family)
MASKSERLLEPGHEAEWAKINEEEARQEAEFAASLSMADRLEFGQRLCDQAFDLFNAVRAAGHGPIRDPRA